MYCRENGMHGAKDSSTYCTKCNKINICHLDIQKRVSYEKWLKYYILLYTGLQKSIFNTLQLIAGEDF